MTEQRKSFAEMRRELAEKRGRQLDTEQRPLHAVPSPAVDEADIPDVLGDRSEDDLLIDKIIDSIEILDAYRRWIGKPVNESTVNKREGVMVTCPWHDEDKPSAWVNQDKKLWTCGHSIEGGDIYDLAAIYFSMPDYKEGKNFHELRRRMAESYGFRSKTVAGKEVVWQESEETTQDAPSRDTPSTQQAPEKISEPTEESNVTVLHAKDIEEDLLEDIGYPMLDWNKIVPKDTFLHSYLEATSHDDAPEEYHFWHGLLALGHAVGRKAFLNDTRPVYGNLLVCLLGGTGYGKSRSRSWLDDVIEEALPYVDNGLDTTGCKLVPVPASGENLIAQFQHIAWDPSLPKGSTPDVRTPINGIVDYDEFAGLLQRASRQGATLKQIIMGFSDARNKISSSSNTGGTFEAYRPFCSITASTQPKAVRQLLTHTDTSSGFLNRWIFVGGPRKKREVMGGVHTSIHVNLDESIDFLKKVRGWGAVERDVRFTEDGFDEFETFMRKRVYPVQEGDDSDLLARLDLTMKRLVLLFCINEKTTEADEGIVRRVEPILEYIMKNYAILNAEIGVSQMSEVTTEILKQVRRIQKATNRGASARDIVASMKRKNFSPDLIKRALETMVALDWIDVVKQDKGPGRPTIRYKAVNQ